MQTGAVPATVVADDRLDNHCSKGCGKGGWKDEAQASIPAAYRLRHFLRGLRGGGKRLFANDFLGEMCIVCFYIKS